MSSSPWSPLPSVKSFLHSWPFISFASLVLREAHELEDDGGGMEELELALELTMFNMTVV